MDGSTPSASSTNGPSACRAYTRGWWLGIKGGRQGAHAGADRLDSCRYGQAVKRGERLVVLQAMKMENELTSPRDGRVSAIHVEEAQTVEQGFVLVTLEGE